MAELNEGAQMSGADYYEFALQNEFNEGLNVNLDYYGKVECRVFTDEQFRLSDAEINDLSEEEESEEQPSEEPVEEPAEEEVAEEEAGNEPQ